MTTHHPLTTTTSQDRGIPLAPLAVFLLVLLSALAVVQVRQNRASDGASTGRTVVSTDTFSPERARAVESRTGATYAPADEQRQAIESSLAGASQATESSLAEASRAIWADPRPERFDIPIAPVESGTPAESGIVHRYDTGASRFDIPIAPVGSGPSNEAARPEGDKMVYDASVGHYVPSASIAGPDVAQGELRYDPSVGYPVPVTPTAPATVTDDAITPLNPNLGYPLWVPSASASVLDYPFGERSGDEPAAAWDGALPTQVPG